MPKLQKTPPALYYTCKGCGEKFDRNDPEHKPETIGGAKFCPACAVLHDGENADLTELKKYMNEHPNLINHDADYWPNVNKQLIHLTETDGFKYKGILLTFKYIFDEENDIKSVPNFKKDIDFTWLIEKYYPIVKREAEKIREHNKKVREFYQDEENRKATIDLPPKYIYIDIEAMKEQKEKRLAAIKDKIYGVTFNIEDIEDDELEEE